MEEMEVVDEVKKPKKFRWELYLGMFFMGLLLFIGYTSFYGSGFASFTGNAIGPIESSSISNGVNLDARLLVPESLPINSRSDKFSIRASDDVDFLIGDQRISLEKGDSIIIDGFSGLVNIKGKVIKDLSGRGSKIFVDGLPITHKSDSLIRLSASDLSYSYLEFDNLYLESLSYYTSGTLKINDNKLIIGLEEEKFSLDEFEGGLIISSELRMNGKIDRSSVKNLIESSNYGLEENLVDNTQQEDNA